jgi:thiol-disulfide isomerase/thioredoxin
MAEKNKKINFVKRTANPRLHIIKQGDGAYVINYGQNDKNRRKNVYNRADLNQEIQKLFGYDSWEEYKEQNREDLYRKKGPATEDGKLQVPTLFPFHVAYALEEFSDTFNPRDYEVVGVPGEGNFITIGPDTSWWQVITAMTPKEMWEEWSDLSEDALVDIAELPEFIKPFSSDEKIDAAATRRMAIKNDERIQRDKKRAELEAKITARVNDIRREALGIDPNVMKKIDLVQQTRNAFFGTDGGGSILKIAMYEPLEVLSNKDVIKRVEDQFKSKFDIQAKFQGNFPVNHPKNPGRYWNNDFKPSLVVHLLNSIKNAAGEPESSVYSTSDETEAFVVDNNTAKDALSRTTMLNERLLLESVVNTIVDAMKAASRNVELAKGMDSWMRGIAASKDPVARLRREAGVLIKNNEALREPLEDFYRRGGSIDDPTLVKYARLIFTEKNKMALDIAKRTVRPGLATGKFNIVKREMLKRINKIVPGLGDSPEAMRFVRELDSPKDLRKVSKDLVPYDTRPLDGSGGKRIEDYMTQGRTTSIEAEQDWAYAVAEAFAERAKSIKRAEDAKTAKAAAAGVKVGDEAPVALGKTADDILNAETVTVRDVLANETAVKNLEEIPMRPENVELLKRIEALERSAPSSEQFAQLIAAVKKTEGVDPQVAKALEKIAKKADEGKSSLLWKAAKIHVYGGGFLIGVWILCRDGKTCQLMVEAAANGDIEKVVKLAMAAFIKAYEDLKKFLEETGWIDPDTPPDQEEGPSASALQASSKIGVNMEYYLMPKGWRGLNYLTAAEKVLADRIGAKTDILKKLAQEKIKASGASVTPILPTSKMEQVPLNEVNALFFGHSNTNVFARKLARDIKKAGGRAFVAKQVGLPDPGLAKEIKNIKGKFTHAYLFLNGSAYKKENIYKGAKKQIIDHVQNTLGVPKENIIVSLPPVNNASYDEEDLRKRFKKEKDVSRYLSHRKMAANSRRRGVESNVEARKFFESLGIKVASQIATTNPADFTDGLHYRTNAAGARQFRKDQLSNLTPKPQEAPAAAPASRDEQQISSGEEVNILQHLAEGKVTIFNFTNVDICPPCRELAPILKEISSNSNVALRKIKIIPEESPAALQYSVDAIPHLAIYDAQGNFVASSDAQPKSNNLTNLIVSNNVVNHTRESLQQVIGKALEKTGGQKQTFSGEWASYKKDNKQDRQTLAQIIVEEAIKAGEDPLFSLNKARVEGFDPNSTPTLKQAKKRNPKRKDFKEGVDFGKGASKGFHGVFQFKGTSKYQKFWNEQYGLEWPRVYDPRHQAEVFMKILKEKKRQLRSVGLPKDDYLLYLSWQQGLDGTRQIWNAANEGREVTGDGLKGWKNKSSEWRDAHAARIRANMRNNWYGSGRGDDPSNFLRDWESRYARFMSKTEKEFSNVINQVKSGSVTENKILKKLFNIADQIENELV